MTYRDSSQKTLADYPRPSVAVDTAVLTIAPEGSLSVALVRSENEWRLPGTFLHEGEVLADAVRRSLRDKAAITGVDPHQLHVFDALDRDDRGWVLSVAHFVAVRSDYLEIDGSGASLVPVSSSGELKYDHTAIVERAVSELRRQYRRQPDPFGLLVEPFTIRELQRIHEAVAGETLMRDTFRRRMEAMLRPTGSVTSGVVGKPAREFTR